MPIRPILLINCLITEDVFSIYDRGLLSSHNKFDVFKYMLQSVSVLEFERTYIHFTLADAYASRAGELDALLAEYFPSAKVRHQRLEQYAQWTDFIESNDLLAGPPILLMCNDDHIYLHHDAQYFNTLLAGYQSLLATGPLVSVVYSHWPESRRFEAPLSIIQSGADFDISLSDNSHDGIQMLSPELMRRWFFHESSHLAPDARVRRSEDLGAATDLVFKILPKQELFRHFDGYSSSGISITACSPLTIPVGFFEKRVRLCFANLLSKDEVVGLMAEGFTVCSPATALIGGLALSHPLYDITPETIPLAWVAQIAEIAHVGTYDANLGHQCQNLLRQEADFSRPRNYSLYLNKEGNFDVQALSEKRKPIPYLGYHKTPTRTAKKSIVLLQDVRFYKRDHHSTAIENVASALAAQEIALHILLLYSSSVLLQGRMFAVLNNLLGASHVHVDSVLSVNCPQSLSSNDLGQLIESTYGETQFCMCHNADPIKGLPIMVDVLAQNEKYFPSDHATLSFIAAGIPNVFGASTNMLIASSGQFKDSCRTERKMGPDIIESLLIQMEEEQFVMHSAKVLPRRPEK